MSDDNKKQSNTPSPKDKVSKDSNEKNNVIFYNNQKSQNKTDIRQTNPAEKNETVNPTGNSNPRYASKDSARILQKTKKHKLSKKRIAINIISVILGVIMIIIGSGCIVAYSYFNRIKYKAIDSYENSSPNSGQTSNVNSSNSSLSKVDAYDGPLLNDPMVLNVMLFGADTRADSDKGNSDTIMLMSIDTRHKKIKLLSFMRDTYVKIPGYEDQKLNAAYSFGGAALSVSTIQLNYGILIDRYAVVDFNSFKHIIDVLGGIDVELTADEIEYINWQYWINNQAEYKNTEDPEQREIVRNNLKQYWLYNIPNSEKSINPEKYTFHENSSGESVTTVHLNGRQALWHARNRGEDGICSGDDYTRTERQRDVISTIINEMKNANISTILSIIYEIGPMITTNFKTSEITSLATNITKYLNYDIISKSTPELDTLGTDFYYSDANNPVYINGEILNCIVIYDWDSYRKKVANFIFENQPEESSETSTSSTESSGSAESSDSSVREGQSESQNE